MQHLDSKGDKMDKQEKGIINRNEREIADRQKEKKVFNEGIDFEIEELKQQNREILGRP